MKFLFSILLLTGCAPMKGFKALVQDAEITPYIQEFEKRSTEYYNGGISAQGINYYFEDWGYNQIAGVCWRKGSERRIIINTAYWKNYSHDTREILVFHELGHCALYRDHVEIKDKNGTPISIMFPSIISPYAYFGHRDYYIEELFMGDDYANVNSADSIEFISTGCSTSFFEPVQH